MTAPWATGFCSAHQEPDPTCRICNPAVEELELTLTNPENHLPDSFDPERLQFELRETRAALRRHGIELDRLRLELHETRAALDRAMAVLKDVTGEIALIGAGCVGDVGQ